MRIENRIPYSARRKRKRTSYKLQAVLLLFVFLPVLFSCFRNAGTGASSALLPTAPVSEPSQISFGPLATPILPSWQKLEDGFYKILAEINIP